MGGGGDDTDNVKQEGNAVNLLNIGFYLAQCLYISQGVGIY